jgi:hypothetical protein
MKVRTVLIATAIVSSILGATVTYLVLSVPNDIRASALLKQARRDMSDGKNDQARESLARIIQQYPRTDAAAAATVALVTLGDKEKIDVERALTAIRARNDALATQLDALKQTVEDLKNAPPKVVTVTAPPPAPKPAPKPAAKKKAPVRRSTRRH